LKIGSSSWTASSRPPIEVVNAPGFELLRPVDVVAVVAVAAVDQHVPLADHLSELAHRLVGDRGGHHHPDRPRRLQLLGQILKRGRAGGTFLLQRGHRGRPDVVDHALVAVTHQAPDHVGAHPPESNHSHLH
jgi:hypothetical protein